MAKSPPHSALTATINSLREEISCLKAALNSRPILSPPEGIILSEDYSGAITLHIPGNKVHFPIILSSDPTLAMQVIRKTLFLARKISSNEVNKTSISRETECSLMESWLAENSLPMPDKAGISPALRKIPTLSPDDFLP